MSVGIPAENSAQIQNMRFELHANAFAIFVAERDEAHYLETRPEASPLIFGFENKPTEVYNSFIPSELFSSTLKTNFDCIALL